MFVVVLEHPQSLKKVDKSLRSSDSRFERCEREEEEKKKRERRRREEKKEKAKEIKIGN